MNLYIPSFGPQDANIFVHAVSFMTPFFKGYLRNIIVGFISLDLLKVIFPVLHHHQTTISPKKNTYPKIGGIYSPESSPI